MHDIICAAPAVQRLEIHASSFISSNPVVPAFAAAPVSQSLLHLHMCDVTVNQVQSGLLRCRSCALSGWST